jgi:long-chain fatty acid transport protein
VRLEDSVTFGKGLPFMNRNLARWIAVCACFAWVSNALANGVMLDGLTPRSIGRGGTNMGFADNGGIVLENPGAMTNVNGNGLLDVGIDTVIVSGHYMEPGNNAYSSTGTPAPQIGIVKKSADGDWALGVAILTPAGFAERFDMQGPFPVSGTQRYESFGALVKVPVGLAYKVTDNLSIGGSVGLGVCNASLEGPYTLNGPTLPGVPTDFRTHGWGADFIWSAGLQYQWSECTTFGAAYQSAAPFRLDGNTAVDVPGLGSSSYDSVVQFEWPQSVAVGVRHALCECRTVSFDVVWFNWSQAFDNFGMELTGPGNPFFPPQIIENFPLNWRDTVSFRFGFEQQINPCTALRLGYVYHRNPIPTETLSPFIQGFLEHTFAVGITRYWNCWEIDLAWQHMFGPRQRVGTSPFFGGDFSGSTQDVMADIIGVSFIRPF